VRNDFCPTSLPLPNPKNTLEYTKPTRTLEGAFAWVTELYRRNPSLKTNRHQRNIVQGNSPNNASLL
jgi:hypothetical protein